MDALLLFKYLIARCAEEAGAMAFVGVPLLLAALLRNSGGLKAVARQSMAASAPFNMVVFVFDLIVMSIPLAILYAGIVLWLDGADRSGLVGKLALPEWALVGLVVFVGDGVSYFRHRLEHCRWLWPSHAMHHSDETMNCLTIFRFHPINRITTMGIDMSMLLLLGFPLWAVAVNTMVRHHYGIFVHANVPWTLGPLGCVLVSPAMHRWHHVREGQGMRSNFATVFSVFDRAFGTYYCPGPCAGALGVEGLQSKAFLPQLMMPFKVFFRR